MGLTFNIAIAFQLNIHPLLQPPLLTTSLTDLLRILQLLLHPLLAQQHVELQFQFPTTRSRARNHSRKISGFVCRDTGGRRLFRELRIWLVSRRVEERLWIDRWIRGIYRRESQKWRLRV